MLLGMGVPKTFTVLRRELRVPMEVGVQISGHVELPGSEATFTQNISSQGARVFSTRKWKINDRLRFATPQWFIPGPRTRRLLRVGARLAFRRRLGVCRPRTASGSSPAHRPTNSFPNVKQQYRMREAPGKPHTLNPTPLTPSNPTARIPH